MCGTQEPHPNIVGEYAPWDINKAADPPTIIHVTIPPTAVLKNTLQLIPEQIDQAGSGCETNPTGCGWEGLHHGETDLHGELLRCIERLQNPKCNGFQPNTSS